MEAHESHRPNITGNGGGDIKAYSIYHIILINNIQMVAETLEASQFIYMYTNIM